MMFCVDIVSINSYNCELVVYSVAYVGMHNYIQMCIRDSDSKNYTLMNI